MSFTRTVRFRCTLLALAAAPGVGASPAGGAIIDPGLYRLHNHPDGAARPPAYGLRLDELINLTDDHDVFTFDFDAEGASMLLSFDGSRIRIFGTAFGGLDTGRRYDPSLAGYWAIDFTYGAVAPAPGDDDLVATTPDFSNRGTITRLATGERIDLFDFSGEHPHTFRLGNDDDDLGHRAPDLISGWGWIDHHEPGSHVYSSDWIFTVDPAGVPAPPTVVGPIGLLAVPRSRLRRRRRN